VLLPFIILLGSRFFISAVKDILLDVFAAAIFGFLDTFYRKLYKENIFCIGLCFLKEHHC